MAASILRYDDPRLYGSLLTKPFHASYEWIRTIGNPLHPKANLIVECGVRGMKAITGAFALLLTALPALVGRLIQVLHYHLLSSEARQRPPAIEIDEKSLPNLCKSDGGFHSVVFHGTSDEAAIQILRWGFDPGRASPGARVGDAVYVSEGEHVSADYNSCQLVITLNLRVEESAYIGEAALSELKGHMNNKSNMADLRELFLRNGYRAIRYPLVGSYGHEDAWAIFDPSCLSIERIKRSPEVAGAAASSSQEPQLLAN